MKIELDIERSLTLPMRCEQALPMLHDLPGTIGRFPNLKKLTKLDEQSYFWEMKTMGSRIAKIAHDVSYGAKYALDEGNGRLSWEPIAGRGNAVIRGSFQLTPAGDETRLTFTVRGTLNDVPVPLLYRPLAPKFIAAKFTALIERFLERTREALEAAPPPKAAAKTSQENRKQENMKKSDVLMGRGLRLLNRAAALPIVDRLGLRKTAERVLFETSKNAFRGAGAVSRTFSATTKMLKPARLPSARPADLFDLTPTEDQEMLREAVLAFADEQLRPAALAADTACLAPAELLKQCAELGIATLSVPEEFGGSGSERSAMTNVLIAEALAHGDFGLAVACLAPSGVSTALVLWGDEAQQARYLPSFTGEDLPAAALAVQEPQALFDPFELRTIAKVVNGGYKLDGVKSMVPLAAQAELFIVAARIEGRGPALFIVESSTAGLSVTPEPAMGLRAAATGRLTLEGVELPIEALLGGGDAEVYAECIRLGRLGWCALSVGTAQSALDYLIPYVNERVAFGEPISHRQAVAFNIANIGVELEAMRLLTWRAASRAEHGQDFARDTAVARRLCAEKGMAIGNDAVQLLGGHGFIKEHPAERWYRDLRAVGFMEGVLLV